MGHIFHRIKEHIFDRRPKWSSRQQIRYKAVLNPKLSMVRSEYIIKVRSKRSNSS